MGPLDKFVLSDDALKAAPGGFQLQFRTHWYRSLPLSCMEPQVKIDGRPIDPRAMTIEANAQVYPLEQMPELAQEWLFVTDAAILRGHEPLTKGQTYAVEFDLNLYIPYILIGPQANPLLAASKISKVLVCQ